MCIKTTTGINDASFNPSKPDDTESNEPTKPKVIL